MDLPVLVTHLSPWFSGGVKDAEMSQKSVVLQQASFFSIVLQVIFDSIFRAAE
jgi:hypothetical protein